ncbi:transcription factor PHYTOCHROME INTERACTING FACTOR-LIKE 15-like [Musa acuminata AAA Group]|uniref:transcription factor PHYTOCHROME INTERACTING FACTOR-LIKE 15-like n=1 Tax=Musa acuminata AAA Group TaxID=214697 RepID=UPI0031DB4024
MRQSTMNRSPPFRSHAGAGGDDDTMAVRRPPSVIAASEMDFFSEFFGPLSPASGAHCAPHPVLAARVSVGVGVSDAADSSEDVEKESSSGMKSIPAVANDTPGCPSEEVDARSKPPRKRKRNRTSEMHNLTERRRRERIKEKLKALQELIPNSHKLHRASLLEEAIGYIKSLQQQLQIMSGGGIYPAPFVSPPAMPCPRMPHFSPFPAAGLNLGMNMGIGMGVPGMASSTGLSPPSSSFPATSLVPMAAVSPISHFQSPMAMHYWPYTASQELPTLSPSTAVCSQALQAELFHSINQSEPSSAAVNGATQAMAPVSLS